jgi:hypothetical protein
MLQLAKTAVISCISFGPLAHTPTATVMPTKPLSVPSQSRTAATDGRVILAHFGNGASRAVVRHGKSIVLLWGQVGITQLMILCAGPYGTDIIFGVNVVRSMARCLSSSVAGPEINAS